MKIVTYQSADAPERIRWMAVFLDGGAALLPVRFLGSAEEVVREAAQSFWDSEQAKLIAKGVKKKAPKPAKATAPPPSEEAI